MLLEPGGERTYVYDLMEDGRPERAAFQWYHDHRLDHTARNVWHGLAGMWIRLKVSPTEKRPTLTSSST